MQWFQKQSTKENERKGIRKPQQGLKQADNISRR